MDPRYGRSFVATRAAVATPHQLASAAAVAMLARGGSAIDALVAANSVLGVVFPHMTGVGGDAFWLIHDGATGEQHVLVAAGRAAAAATRERYSGREIPSRGTEAALTVPGAVDGWLEAHARFGRLGLSECLESAIRYASEGFPVSPGLAHFSEQALPLLRAIPATAAAYLHTDGTSYRPGELLRQPDLAATLAAISMSGRTAFYEGPVAEAIDAAMRRNGGVLSANDLGAHRSDWVTPLRARYRDRTAVNVPPPSQGIAALEILGILECFDVAALADDPAGYVDLVVRATAVAFADRDRYLTDPTFADVPVDHLLQPERLRSAAADLRTAAPAPPVASPDAAGDTTFTCAIDSDGNAAGVIQSLYHEWGSGVVAEGTGVLLGNRGCFFSLDPEHPNRLEPGKRTASTLTSAMLLDANGAPELVYGTMGGEGQPQTQAAIATRIVDFGYSVQEAVDAPRWLFGRTWGEQHRGVRLEGRFGTAVADALAARGHQNVELVEDFSDTMGHAHAIRVLPGRIDVAADPRSDGAALGF